MLLFASNYICNKAQVALFLHRLQLHFIRDSE